MGVQSLWDILGPTARPVRLEALSRKKLAVDASIWIYQFLKAVRDKEGNALPQSHIVGFFRRICKLLYFGIQPVFVFDGGVPVLKRETINIRKNRRQRKAETKRDAAKRLLAIQIQRQAEDVVNSRTKRKDSDDEEMIYLEDLPVNFPQHETATPAKERSPTPNSLKFRKADEYHLPDLTEFKVSKDDERIMPEEEFLESYEDFDHVDGIDINKVDPKSEAFEKLPIATQYMILSHLRLKSRLRMGYKKEQLEDLFPNSMDFSKFQIQQVQRRNFYTQKLMKVAGMGEDGNVTKRIASDKDRKYALIQNEDGWTLAFQSEESSAQKPIDIEDEDEDRDITRDVISYTKKIPVSADGTVIKSEDPKNDSDESDSDFEDVPLDVKQDTETQEEKEIQKAIIASIYDRFKDESKLESNNIRATTTDGYDQAELREAIKQSKLEYLEMQEEEQKVDHLLTSGNPDDKNGKMRAMDPDFGNSFLFDSMKPEESRPEPVKQSQGLGRSFLFSSEEHETGEIHLDRSVGEPETNQDENNVSESPETIESDISDIEVATVNVIEREDGQETLGSSKPKATKSQALPSWFQDEVKRTLNPHNETFVSYKEHEAHHRDKTEEEDAGLIPWYEAKDFLDGEERSTNEVEDEVEEIAPTLSKPQNVALIDQSGNKKKEERRAVAIDYDFEEDEEVELSKQMEVEEGDHEKLRVQIKESHNAHTMSLQTRITEEQLLQEQLQKAKRDSDEVTETMINDVQELLRRFGIPYITAPMEAEAQCAELLKLGLVDGIITDDSDCFLFGGDKIYKNMFNQKQYVECYLRDDIQAKLGLSQKNLIELALLLGSDYTEGIKGIGPVLAMEILAEFETLEKLKKWFDKHTTSTNIDKSNLTSVQKTLLTRIKNGKLYLSDSFPDKVVFDAYMLPEVDSDKDEFKWGVPDLDQIRSYLMYNVNWSQERVDEVMIPLIRDMNRRKAEGTQSTIGEFFPQEYIQSRKEINLGKRMKHAANKLNKKRKTTNV
ncbi:RAD2 [[Candida] subhashii]|uniref:RAD2 n=1 Tax=[Candida] subhashii TaxID=561895 RepID=A0A8J5QWG5_9ASCO|nr:RAD2 [[Candida] subhashii]KAG7666007.1 RAD2 [[Candida] subhashii]